MLRAANWRADNGRAALGAGLADPLHLHVYKRPHGAAAGREVYRDDTRQTPPISCPGSRMARFQTLSQDDIAELTGTATAPFVSRPRRGRTRSGSADLPNFSDGDRDAHVERIGFRPSTDVQPELCWP